MGASCFKRTLPLLRSVREDWFAWLPQEKNHVFDATRTELECSNLILCVTLDEALSFCERGENSLAGEQATVFADLFDRLAIRLSMVIRTIQEHGSHFGIVPNVTALVPSNFRGSTAQRISVTSSLLAKVLFAARSRFFHKLRALEEIVEDLQAEVHEIAGELSGGASAFPGRAWRELEVRAYDLSTCMGEATVVLKSFFCVLPGEELETFREKLLAQVPARVADKLERGDSFRGK
jgi:hypothetical protein